MNRHKTEILIVGVGPAGMAAAIAAAESGKKVTVIDDNPHIGGQIWRAELAGTKSKDAAKLIDALAKDSIDIFNNAQVFASAGEQSLAAETPRGREEFEYGKMIIATGARELFLPFPGWTLPGVFGAGGLQALVKGGLDVNGKRVVVAGTGALLLAVATYLKEKGATVAAIIEQTPTSKINRFGLGLWRSPAKLAQAAALKTKLIGVPYLTDSWVASASVIDAATDLAPSATVSAARPSGRVPSGPPDQIPIQGTLRVSIISSTGHRNHIECDYLACGYHLVPNTELARLLHCKTKDGFVAVDDFQHTSEPDIYCAGEPTGIGGLDASLIEGKIAGHTAAGDEEKARHLFAQRGRTKRFTDALDRTFALRDELKHLAQAETIVCRCEDVQYGALKNFENWRTAKLQTRCGMGPCQGRVCGATCEFIFGWTVDSPRPPIFPVKLENL